MKILIYYFSLSVISLILFLQGFFPIQQNSEENQLEPPIFLKDFKFNKTEIHQQEIDRLIFIVVDALRMDFITKTNTPFISSINKNISCTLSIQVETPTVTLPRIKALTTGSVPQFIDVILNLANNDALTDSFLHQAVAVQKKIVFYGDDTWVKLFPAIFERYEGVSSFFVNDFTEVDNNVTRNVKRELTKNDWDIMILHYLGLDHIGHVYGPFNDLIQPKMQEMDEIIHNIYSASKTWNKRTLILVTGDHGMKDSGGHGGSTYNEIHVPLVAIGLPCKSGNAAQIDVASTLAVLMGLKLTINNVGHVIYDLLPNLSHPQLLYALYYNSLQLQLQTQNFDSIFENALSMHYRFLKTSDKNDASLALELYRKYLESVSYKLVQTSVKQDEHKLLGGLLLLYYFCIILYNSQSVTVYKCHKLECAFSCIILLLFFILPKSLIFTLFYITVITVCIFYKIVAIAKMLINLKPKYSTKMFVIFASILHLVSFVSSSFIEEEHQSWYFFLGSFIFISCFEKYRISKLVVLFIGLRLLRTLNRTGDKWAHLPDLAQWLLVEQNFIYLETFFIVNLLLILVCCILLNLQQRLSLILSAMILILVYVFKIKTQNSALGKLIWFLIAFNLLVGLQQNRQNINHCIMAWTLVCALIMRPYNIILLSSCILFSILISSFIHDITTLTILHVWLGKTFFFLQGHSNSLASIDIACGYVGLQEYNALLVTMQVLSHTYAFPVLCDLLMLKNYPSLINRICEVSVICRLSSILVSCIVTFIQRQHLFVWSVFAPKLLIESSHSIILFVEILLFCGIAVLNNLFNLYFHK